MTENGTHQNGTTGVVLANQRTKLGRFAPGNKLAQGGDRHPGRLYRKAFQEAVTFDDIKKVAQAMCKAAIDKQDPAAAKMVLEYTLGKPKETIELERGQTWNDMLLSHAKERFGYQTEE